MPVSIDAERQAHLRTNEAAILAGLAELEAAELAGTAKDTTLETDTVTVPEYGGRPSFSFEIRRLEPEGWEALQKRNTKAKRPGEPVIFHADDFNCDVIVEASTDETQQVLWRNRTRLNYYGCSDPKELVRKLIPMPGWRNSIKLRVEELMGYGYGMRLQYGSVVEMADAELQQTLGE